MKRVTVIAEAGVNHNGNIDTALALIDAASLAGADFVKFQTFKADKLVSHQAPKAEYQKRNLRNDDDSQFEMLKKLEIPNEWYPVLLDHCANKGITFLSTAFDVDGVDFLESLKIPFYKIPSGEITNKPYLQHVARKGKDIVLSTGMATIEEVKDALNVLFLEGVDRDQITVLHCNTEYPTEMSDVNLLAMLDIQSSCNVKIGYSDHTLGIEIPIASVALGACVIEKHFTLSRTLPGPDHRASLEPDELKAMVQAIRNIELAISGSGKKEPSQSELANRVVARKSIHLAADLEKGSSIELQHLVMKRPGDGISPMEVDRVLGSILVNSLSADSKLLWEHIKRSE